MIEEAFGWIKTVGGPAKDPPQGIGETLGAGGVHLRRHNLTRLLNLMWPKAA
jgi:hypothetical protein